MPLSVALPPSSTTRNRAAGLLAAGILGLIAAGVIATYGGPAREVAPRSDGILDSRTGPRAPVPVAVSHVSREPSRSARPESGDEAAAAERVTLGDTATLSQPLKVAATVSASMGAADSSAATLRRLGFGGRVLDSRGVPVDGVRGTVRSTGDSQMTHRLQTGADGRFAVRDVAEGTAVLRITRPVRTEIRMGVDAVAVPHSTELQLDLGVDSYRGRVLDPAGVPVAGADVHLERTFDAASGIRATSFRAALTDDDGYFAFVGLSDGAGKLTVIASGFATTLAERPARTDTVHSISMRPLKSTGGRSR